MLLDAVGCCWMLFDAVGSCWMLFDAVGSCWMFSTLTWAFCSCFALKMRATGLFAAVEEVLADAVVDSEQSGGDPLSAICAGMLLGRCLPHVHACGGRGNMIGRPVQEMGGQPK